MLQPETTVEFRIGIFVCMRTHDPEHMFRVGPVEQGSNISSDSLTSRPIYLSSSVKAKGNRRLYEAAQNLLLEFT